MSYSLLEESYSSLEESLSLESRWSASLSFSFLDSLITCRKNNRQTCFNHSSDAYHHGRGWGPHQEFLLHSDFKVRILNLKSKLQKWIIPCSPDPLLYLPVVPGEHLLSSGWTWGAGLMCSWTHLSITRLHGLYDHVPFAGGVRDHLILCVDTRKRNRPMKNLCVTWYLDWFPVIGGYSGVKANHFESDLTSVTWLVAHVELIAHVEHGDSDPVGPEGDRSVTCVNQKSGDLHTGT